MSDAIEIAMFESSWFSRGELFWRWVKTPEAKPYIEAFVAQRQPLKRGEPLNLIAGLTRRMSRTSWTRTTFASWLATSRSAFPKGSYWVSGWW
jgi:hypothetical protein